MSRFNHRNNKQRFDLYSFYSLLVKCKVVELLDGQGNTPFDSDTIDQNVWNYAAYLYKDISDAGLLSYLDSDSFRSDSDGQGTTTWPSISKTAAITEAYRPLRRFMYSLDSDEGINNTANTITPGFVRKYYTLPLSDSEGSLRHVNIYSFLKTHVDRWLQFDPYERRKLVSRIIDNMSEDSDVRYRYSHNFLRASEEDSDLARRLTEIYSNVLQSSADSDSDYARNEYIKTAVTALQGLTPGGDSDAARDLANVITGVLNNSSDSDSEIRKQFGWHFLTALYRDSDNQDSDLQNRLKKIIENTELVLIDSPLVVIRKLLPMDSDDTGSIGDSENKFALANFTTLRTDELKKEGLNKDRLVDIDDSEGKIGDTVSNLQWQGDSELMINTHLKVSGMSTFATTKIDNLFKDRLVDVSDSDGRLNDTGSNLQWQNNDNTLVTTKIDVLQETRLNAARVSDLRKDGLVYSSDSDGKLGSDSDLEYSLDSDKLTLRYQDRRIIAIDSEIFFNLLIENQHLYTIDSEGVDSVIKETPIKSQTSWVIGQRGDVYFIDSDQSNQLETKSLVYVSDKVVDTQAELSRAINDTISKQVVFDTWYKFSHQWTGGGTPGTFTYPYNVSELNGWAYDAVADKIYTTVNANSYCGFVSTDTYQNFTFDSTYKSFNDPTNDDDTIASIVGFVTEGTFGQPGYREHTLQLVRVAGGFPMTAQNLGNVQWALVYNYNQDDVRLLVDKTTSAPVATAAWNSYPNGTKVWIRRQGDIITAYCSQMNDATYTKDSDTEIIFDLSSDSDTLKFRGPVRYGYGVHSQRGASWNDVFFKPDQGTYLHYITDGQISSEGGNVYEYKIDSERWVQDSDLTIDNTVGNRFLHNISTRKTFFNNPNNDITYPVMTARKFSDVFNLPILTSPPSSPVAGTFAIADGVNWDPVFYGAPAYVTFWDGEYWYYVDAQ